MIKRIIVGIFGIPLILFTVLNSSYNNLPFLIFLILLNALGLNEMHNIFSKKNIKIDKVYFITCGILMILGLYFQVTWFKKIDFLFNLIFVLSISIYFITFVFSNEFKETILRLSCFTFGLFYISYLSGYFLLLKNLPHGNYLLFSIILLIWFNDSFAYFGGSLLGRKKLGIKASPNKSLAGFCSAIIFSIFSLFISELLFPEHLSFSLIQKFLIGIFFGILVILSDLVESVLKRSANIKDSGALFPGHGGILDIFDSWFLTIPLFYFYLMLFK